MKRYTFISLYLISLSAVGQNVGIGIATPQSDLHIHSEGTSSSTLRLSNNITTAASNRGATLRMLGGNLFIENFETPGNIQLNANGFSGAYITKGVGSYNLFGIVTTSPKQVLHVHSPNSDVSMAITNGITTDGVLRGGRIRMFNENLTILNHETTGNIQFATGNFSRMAIKPNGNIGINNTDPQTWLQVNGSAANSEAIRLDGTTPYQTFYDNNSYRGYIQAWTDALGIGATTGNALRFYTQSGTERLTILDNGNVGVNQPNPGATLQVVSNASGTSLQTSGAIRFTGIGEGGAGQKYLVGSASGQATWGQLDGFDVYNSMVGGGVGTISTGIISEFYNYGAGSAIKVYAGGPGPALISLQGSLSFTPANAAISAQSVNGYGVYAQSYSSPSLYVLKPANASSGGHAAVFENQQPGITSAVTKIIAQNGQPAIELENGAIKVSGTNRTVFQHVTTAGNIISNETVIPNTTLANNITDMLIVTPVWEGVYLNASIGVYFISGSWRIFRQDLAAMPAGVKFNVLVVKQ